MKKIDIRGKAMTTLSEAVGLAVWRASWQGAVLAILVGLLLWGCGERVTPRWRYLLWSVVMIRLLIVVTPGSPWSVFNLAHYGPAQTASSDLGTRCSEESMVPLPIVNVLPDMELSDAEPQRVAASDVEQPIVEPVVPRMEPAVAAPSLLESASETAGPLSFPRRPFSVRRVLVLTWLVGFALLSVRLLVAALLVRRRLLACRAVADRAALEMLESLRRKMGAPRSARLLVTPEMVSPYVAGAWCPRIVVPESLLTDGSHDQLRQVLAHELAHVRRGDLWTNWFLLVARALHWFNPLAWWSVRSMQAEREAACDEMALSVLHSRARASYVETIMELAASLAPPPMTPGMIGLFSSRRGLRSRMERILRPPSARPVGSAVLRVLVCLLALAGLTDAMPQGAEDAPAASASAASASAASPGEAEASAEVESSAKTHTIRGTCIDGVDDRPMAGVRLRLLALEGLVGPPKQVAETISDDQGRFEFSNLSPPRPKSGMDQLAYGVIANAEGRPPAFDEEWSWWLQGQDMQILIAGEASLLGGQIVDQSGRPLSGAIVARYALRQVPVPGVCSAVTSDTGEFLIVDLPAMPTCFHYDRENKIHVRLADESSPDTLRKVRCYVFHPDYPMALTEGAELPAEIDCRLPDCCRLVGTVIDSMTGQPAAGAIVTALRTKPGEDYCAQTDSQGRYHLPVQPANYHVLAQAKDRVSVAITDRECPAGETVEVPVLRLIQGGMIAGHVYNTASGEPETVTEEGRPIVVGLIGPSWPNASGHLAEVDGQGRFRLRAAPGENYPYLINKHGSRMSWDTKQQDPVIVVEGQTVETEITVTPPATAEEKMAAARKVLDSLPAASEERVEGILEEFRKLNHTVDETEIWCLLMRELVTIGPDAVPQLCAELDATNQQRMLRRLGFALRALGDVRAVPALIRAIPKTLQPPMSDYGLIVDDAELGEFMREHDLDKGSGKGTHFGFGRPVREVFGALHAITKQNFEDDTFDFCLSDDPHRQVLQRGLYQKQAERWRDWWEAHWQEFSDDESARSVNLPGVEPSASESPAADSKPRLGTGGVSGSVLSPFTEKGKYVHHFLDLDTGLEPNWPADIPQEEGAADTRELAEWAKQTGVDLMCVIHHSDDGTATTALRAFDMRVHEISQWGAENIEKRLASGKIPEGRPVGDLLLHYDTQAKKYVPDANGAFLYVTREGGMGMVLVTDRVTRKQNLTGIAAGDPMPGVGFQKGVRLTHRVIVR
jgi:beta-lactamase regulating signal transducer with metallopeptidase domain